MDWEKIYNTASHIFGKGARENLGDSWGENYSRAQAKSSLHLMLV